MFGTVSRNRKEAIWLRISLASLSRTFPITLFGLWDDLVRLFRALLAASLTAIFWVWSPELQTQEGSQPSDSHLFIAFSPQSESLSVNAKGVLLTQVLEELSKHVDITVSAEGKAGQSPVWMEFEGLPLKEAIKRLLEGQSYALIVAQESSQATSANSTRIRRIHLLENSPTQAGVTAHGVRASPDEDEIEAIENEDDLYVLLDTVQNGASPDLRSNALYELAERDNEQSFRAAQIAIRDEDDEVRETALDVLEGLSLEERFEAASLELLAEAALTDPNPDLRIVALEMLAESEEDLALQVMQDAFDDPDAEVRKAALDLHEELESGDD